MESQLLEAGTGGEGRLRKAKLVTSVGSLANEIHHQHSGAGHLQVGTIEGTVGALVAGGAVARDLPVVRSADLAVRVIEHSVGLVEVQRSELQRLMEFRSVLGVESADLEVAGLV